jgi:hypothetical protein
MNDDPVELASDALRRLRGAMSGMEAPPSRRAAALDAYRNRPMRRRASTLAWAVAAIAAAVVLVIGGVYWMRPVPVPLKASLQPTAPPAPVQEVKAAEPSPAVATMAQRHPVAPPRAVAAKRTKRHPAQPPAEIATDFLAIPYAPPLYPGEGGQVIRVRLPRAAMSSVGLPAGENGWLEHVPADIVVGGDGIARAVRFVGFTK